MPQDEFVHTLLTARQEDMDAAMRAIITADVTGIIGRRAQLPQDIMMKASAYTKARIVARLRQLRRNDIADYIEADEDL